MRPTPYEIRHEVGCRAVGTLKALIAFGYLNHAPDILANVQTMIEQFDKTLNVRRPVIDDANFKNF